MNEREQCDELLRRFGGLCDQQLSLGELNDCSFRFGETNELGHFQYLERSAQLVLWATVGFLPPDRFAPLRMARLMQMQDLGGDSGGFTLGTEPETGRVVAVARRAPAELDSASLAGWVDELDKALGRIRQALAEEFPVEIGDFDLLAVGLGDENESDGEP